MMVATAEKLDTIPLDRRITVRTDGAAELLSVRVAVIGRWYRQGLLPSFKIDGMILFPVRRLIRWANENVDKLEAERNGN
jgi:hypothetical protein